MTDFCITAVRYNSERNHITHVHVREEKPEVQEIGATRIVPREFVADLIRLGKATFQTRTKNQNNQWTTGSQVHLIDKIYLTTNKNNSKKDNLENLPEF